MAKDNFLSSGGLRRHVPLVNKCVYFDNSATTFTPSIVIQAMNDYYRNYCVNIERGSYALAQRATKEYELGRAKVAKFLLGCLPCELIFTRNFTEGANLVAYALEHALLDRRKNKFSRANKISQWRACDNIVCTSLEHHSNLMPWMRLSKNLGIKLRIVNPTQEGKLTPDAFVAAVDKNTKLVAFQQVSNATGAIHPAREIIARIKKINPRTLIFIDGAQAVGHMAIDFKSLKCDFYAFSGHKGALGPKGTGGLVVRKELLNILHPFFLGGGTVADVTLKDYKLKDDFGRFDAGTPNIPGLIGLGAAAEFLGNKIGLERIRRHELMLLERLFEGLSDIRGVEFYGPKDINSRAGIFTFNLKGWLCHDISLALDEKWRILTRAGHHCCIPAMRFLGLLKGYGGNVRASFHYYNTLKEIDLFLEALRKLSR